ncbi:hypothetical protein [Virgibacillus necropolis]|uniref:Uncharacterized protein n=1 Tax=Virgibacillus necropolis TaxID=163877 RepID=A0A221MF82_9BACI|nr:hypothetical protein [Virgibacillus necropolis]ASN06249.1 hypothetical protein CFK40_15070 [Virgibacillus necropolis]
MDVIPDDKSHLIKKLVKEINSYSENLLLVYKNKSFLIWIFRRKHRHLCKSPSIWDYVNQFGTVNVKALTIVDQSPSVYILPGGNSIKGVLQAIQKDQNGFNNEFIHGMFKENPDLKNMNGY